VSSSWNPFRRIDPTFATLFERAGLLVVDAAEALEVLFATDRINAEAFARLDDLEHRADLVTHDVLSRLERGFRSPLPAVDTRRLIGEIDSIVDAAENAGELAVLCGVGQATTTAQGMTAVLVKSAREVASLIGFIGGGTGYRPYVARLHEYEHEGDDLWTEGFSALFTGEMAPLDVIRWQGIYEQLEAAIDSCETAGRVIELALDRSRT
jgi:uncharacterized protein Yka (UPF0111/DUF47 family)